MTSSTFRADVLAGKRILITGGGTGLGKELARHFVAHGASVHICGRREGVLQAAVTELRESALSRRQRRYQSATCAMPRPSMRWSSASGPAAR